MAAHRSSISAVLLSLVMITTRQQGGHFVVLGMERFGTPLLGLYVSIIKDRVLERHPVLGGLERKPSTSE